MVSASTDQQYFAGRALEEREKSRRATDSAAAAIHAKLADRYERLAAGEGAPRPALRITTRD